MSLFPLVGLPSTSLLIYPLSYFHPELTIRSGWAAASTDPAAKGVALLVKSLSEQGQFH